MYCVNRNNQELLDGWENRKHEVYRTNREIMDTGLCPKCNRTLVKNRSIAGYYWTQCAGYMLWDDQKDGPICSFQIMVPYSSAEIING